MALSDTEFTLICRARRRLCDLEEPSLTVASIARESGISYFHFIRRFQIEQIDQENDVLLIRALHTRRQRLHGQ